VLRIWRSWVGLQIYQARIEPGTNGSTRITRLEVEQDPDRHRGLLTDEPLRFERVTALVINALREFRAGTRPTEAEGAGPKPPTWPT
jgi:hypothetical protein